MEQIKFIQVTEESIKSTISEVVKTEIDSLKKDFQPKELPKFVTRNYVADEILHCDISTVHNLTTRGILKKYGCGGRVYYRLDEVFEAIIKIN